jgi:hypothetical protein
MGVGCTDVGCTDVLRPAIDALDLIASAYGGTLEDARKVLDLLWYDGIREEANRELLVALLAAQTAQIQDLRERVTRLELAR